MTDAETVRVLHVFRASPAQVYDAWLDRSLPHWMSTVPTGEVVQIDQHAVPGGSFSIVARRHGALIEHVGHFLELDRPRRIVFTWAVRGQEAPVRVEVELTPHDAGGTLLTLSHRIDPSWSWFLSRTEPEWMAMFEELDRRIEAGAAPV